MAGLYGLTSRIMTTNLRRLEDAEVRQDVNRVREAMRENQDKLSAWSLRLVAVG